jgi:molybdopterin synthase catalytic subunit
MKGEKIKDIFMQGAIGPAFIGECIARHQSKTRIGGHSIFLGQVRADETGDKKVIAIDYSAYAGMALEEMSRIREDIFEKYPLECMHVYHSLGRVEAGQVCLFVFTSSAHRKAAMDACGELVERIKSELPVWGKELYMNGTHEWKRNK